MTLPLLWVEDPTLQQNFDLISVAISELQAVDFIGSGNPNTVITASPGATYRNRAGGAGTTFWVKESGAGNVGWVGK